jgi:hypothetical protein
MKGSSLNDQFEDLKQKEINLEKAKTNLYLHAA